MPAYDGWRARDPGDTVEVDARYAALPATTRDLMVAHAPRGFVRRTADLDAALASGAAELVRTSGTTGPPVTLVWHQAWWDASEQAGTALHADLAAVATGRDPEAVLASARCVGPGEHDRPLALSERTLGRLLFPNERAEVGGWTDDDVRRMARELVAFAPAVLEGEPAYLAAFCARAEALAVELPRPRIVTLSYTAASRLERARIERTLRVPVANVHGSTESGTVLVECERGRLHQNAASCRIELAPGPRADLARLLVTPFGHPLVSYLRFDPGDLVRVAAAACPCGRAGGAIERLEGREREVIAGRDGGVVTFAELDDAVAAARGAERIISYQVEGHVLRATATGPLDTAALVQALRPLGDFTVERVAALVPELSGKYARVRR
ncbi:MAG TPA: hypothetical protein VHE35_35275 [Kofleriaceae bacterium]|nr:hypothetical protein [Kofleriaceae bacterium]